MNTNISGNGVLIRKGTNAILPISDAQYIQYHNSNLTTALPNVGAVAVENVKDGLDALYNKITNASPMTEITYANLVTAKTNGTLNPGSWYRITDYATTTTQADTQSANHPFDVIVLATSANTLSEEARAIQHSGDTYFANSNLNAWKIWYRLENDTSRFAWADVNGKGVIYRMIDEFNNDVPYDFKNIQYQMDNEWFYTFSDEARGDNSLTYSTDTGFVISNHIDAFVPFDTTKMTLGKYIFWAAYVIGNTLIGNCGNIKVTHKAYVFYNRLSDCLNITITFPLNYSIHDSSNLIVNLPSNDPNNLETVSIEFVNGSSAADPKTINIDNNVHSTLRNIIYRPANTQIITV